MQYKAEITAATAADVEVIHQIMETVKEGLSDKNSFVADDKAFISEHIERRGFTLIARVGNEVAGFLIIRIPGTDIDNLGRDIGFVGGKLQKVAHMESVAVLPEHRGHGLQKRLMAKAEDRLRILGYRYLMATVYPGNKPSLTSFISSGYAVVLTKEKYSGLMRNILLKTIE